MQTIKYDKMKDNTAKRNLKENSEIQDKTSYS